MVDRIKIYKILGRTHFFAGILIFVFAFFYIITGLIISKHKWFPTGKETIQKHSYGLNFNPDTTQMEKFGDEIKQQFSISGRTDYTRNNKNEIVLNIFRPGNAYNIVVRKNLDSLTITHREKISFGEISTRLHRIHGFKGGPLYLIWGTLLDLSALAMIIFSVTGIIIWFRSRKRYKYGWFVLIPVMVLGVMMYLYIY